MPVGRVAEGAPEHPGSGMGSGDGPSVASGVLGEIVARTRADLRERQARRPLATVRAACTPSDRNFTAALRRQRPGFILEHKRASPSAGGVAHGARAGGDRARVCALRRGHLSAL